jgi:predicted secreted Zn-dependent protease
MSSKFPQPGLALALVLLCGTWGPAYCEVVARNTVSYFDIRGNTADELDAAMNASGPTTIGASSHHPAATRIRFGGKATYVNDAGRCRIGGVVVTVDTEIVLPRWRDRRHADRRLSAVWDTLSVDIERHEAHHVQLAKNYARRMEKAILALPPADSCDLLQARVMRELDRAIAVHDKAQARFDEIEAENFQNRIKRPMAQRVTPQHSNK